jgi:hypothetical protein
MNHFVSGSVALASLVAGLFFLRFWWSTRDRFFFYFAASFWLESLNRVCLGLFGEVGEDIPLYYVIRLISYGLILLAIWEKNRLPQQSK